MKRANVSSLLLLLLCAATGLACGPYRIKYEYPSRIRNVEQSVQVVRTHAHGIGPLLWGGGPFFALIQPVNPALIDYTGAVDTRRICPAGYDGIGEVEHYNNFSQSSLAGLISSLVVVNAYHRSSVVYECVRAPEPIVEDIPEPTPEPDAAPEADTPDEG